MKAVIPIASAYACRLLLASAPAAPLDEAEQAMQARQFDTAVELLSKAGAGAYPSYLRAVALYQAEKHSEAASTCEALLRDFPGSEWQHKARFLMARSLIALKDHQAAESILAGEAERIFSPGRKQSIAMVLVDFADKLAREPAANELDALPAESLVRPATWAGLLGYFSPDHAATPEEHASASAAFSALPSARLLSA